MKKLITWSVYILSTCIITAFLYKVDPSSPFEAFFAACFVSVGPALIVLCIYQLKWRHDNGVDLFATLETDKRKLKKHMLFIMQYHGIEENLKELNDIFRNYPQWELHKWEVFRAWYKAQIDHMVLHPDIYGLSLNGEPYKKRTTHSMIRQLRIGLSMIEITTMMTTMMISMMTMMKTMVKRIKKQIQ